MVVDGEHLPWVGPNYLAQRPEDRLLIVGFSHWGRFSDDKADDPEFTRNVFARWVFDGSIRFFNTIPGYFGEERTAFWNRVAFANTLPTTVGDEDERYSDGTPEQRAQAPARTLRLVADMRPARVFVFSRKAWTLWPDFTGSLQNCELRVENVGKIEYGTYVHDDGEAIAFGFRHPQFAPTVELTALVQAALAFQP